MYADFVHRVHRCRTNSEMSKQIQDCCAYIELHAEEEIPIDQLAKRFGYSRILPDKEIQAGDAHQPDKLYQICTH